ncbi:MAG: zincin-like metallopeptidase domain-containing protein, partial [Planctomycetota bacterium]
EQPVDPITDVQDVVDGFPSPPRIEHAGYQAFYEPKADRVQIAPAQRFASHESYYATLFHELAHATGHSTRLNRGLDEQPPPFGSPDYSKEELIAEMGAAFLCAVAGISPATIELSAAYIDGWRRKLKDNKKLLVQAAGQGQRAADHILGVNWDESGNIVAATAPGRDVSVQPAPIDLG